MCIRDSLARVREHLVPPLTPLGATAFEHRRQVKTEDPRTDPATASHRLFERFTGLVREPETADWLKPVQLLTQAGELGVSERRQPPMIELDGAKARLTNKIDETFQADGMRVGPGRPGAVETHRIGETVGIE